jgi:hypothetical protein
MADSPSARTARSTSSRNSSPNPGWRCSYQIAASSASCSASGSFLTTKLMKSLAHPLDGSVPGFQQFRMCHSQFAATTYLDFLLVTQFVRLLAEQFSSVLLEPDRQSLSFFSCQTKNRILQLFYAHVIQFNKPGRTGELEISPSQRPLAVSGTLRVMLCRFDRLSYLLSSD